MSILDVCMGPYYHKADHDMHLPKENNPTVSVVKATLSDSEQSFVSVVYGDDYAISYFNWVTDKGIGVQIDILANTASHYPAILKCISNVTAYASVTKNDNNSTSGNTWTPVKVKSVLASSIGIMVKLDEEQSTMDTYKQIRIVFM